MLTLEAVLGIYTWRVTVPSLCDGHVRGRGYLGHSLAERVTMTALFCLCVLFLARGRIQMFLVLQLFSVVKLMTRDRK